MRKRAVNADTALSREQGLGICGYFFRGHICNLNVCGFAVMVLWEYGPTDILVMRRCAVSRCDFPGLTEMRTDFLQYGHQLGIYENRIWAVLVKKYSRKSKQYCWESITKSLIALRYMVIQLFIFCYRKETSGTSLPLVSSLLFCYLVVPFFIKKSDFRLSLI